MLSCQKFTKINYSILNAVEGFVDLLQSYLNLSSDAGLGSKLKETTSRWGLCFGKSESLLYEPKQNPNCYSKGSAFKLPHLVDLHNHRSTGSGAQGWFLSIINASGYLELSYLPTYGGKISKNKGGQHRQKQYHILVWSWDHSVVTYEAHVNVTWAS